MFQVFQPSRPHDKDEPDSYDKVSASTNRLNIFATLAQFVPSQKM